jgi:23S rRNA (guanine745-N1)-methyltransferase
MTLKRRLRLSGDEVRTLVGMTPSARHLDPSTLPADEVEATAAVEITVFR